LKTSYSYPEAKALIGSICEAAHAGEYDTHDEFHRMLDSHPDIAAQGYNSFGKIFFWNEASVRLYGYSERAAVNQDLFELILPPEMRRFARDMIAAAGKTGKTPDAAACDLLHRSGDYITVFSGHLMFQWDKATTPEFYCIDVAISSPGEAESRGGDHPPNPLTM
jgi:PAS domain S-box-containing protein